MKCEVCKQGVIEDGISLFRINLIGEDGIWRCRKHLTDEQKNNIHPEVDHIVSIFEENNNRNNNRNNT